MSRSYRKTPKIGCGTRVSERSFKKEYNGKRRAMERSIISSNYYEELDDIIFPEKHIEYSDVWSSKTDGPKMYIGYLNNDRTPYNLRFRDSKKAVIITAEFLETIHERYTGITPELYKYLKDRFVDEGEYQWSTYSTEITETIDEVVQEQKEAYKKLMRK